MRDFFKPALVMFLTCLLAGGSLALVNAVTKEPIAENEKKERENAMKIVQPRADGFNALLPNKAWEALAGGTVIGYVLRGESQGYSGPISVTFGIDREKKVTGVKIVTQTETPGLGAKIVSPAFTEQYRGKTLDQLILKKDDPAAGTIDAITGATISPRAVTKAVHDALRDFLQGAQRTGSAAEEAAP